MATKTDVHRRRMPCAEWSDAASAKEVPEAGEMPGTDPPLGPSEAA